MPLRSFPKAEPNVAIAEATVDEVDEVTPLMGASQVSYATNERDAEACNEVHTHRKDEEKASGRAMLSILSVLLIGVFVSQADTSLVLATYGQISSEFNDLQDASWLLSSYMLAMCVSQALYGKLSDIWGRKAMLQVAYALFALGSLFCGLGQSMGQLIAARALQGMGGAGMVCLVSILITDLVPLRDVASYRSYVNIVQTVGRSCGGAIGGALAQSVGWRWAFLGQVPLTAAAMVLVGWKLKNTSKHEDQDTTHWQRLKRVDFPGVACLSTTVLSALLIFDMGGEKVSWTSPVLIGLAVATVVFGSLFTLVESKYASEPIFPLRLLKHSGVVLSYLLLMLANASQTALMLFVPLYFEITKNASMAEGGAYMIPAILGNTVGGLLTGAFIKRSGRYKMPVLLASMSGCLCFALLLGLWHGNTPAWQSIFIFPGGFATGMAHASLFVALATSIDEKDMAIAGSGLYLSGNIGAVTGLSLASAIFKDALRTALQKNLHGVAGGKQIMRRALDDYEFVRRLDGKMRELVVGAYVSSFSKSFAVSLGCCGAALVIGLFIKEKTLQR